MKAQVNVRDLKNRTPLHAAASSSDHDILLALIEAKCIVDLADSDHKSPLDLAESYECEDVLKFAGADGWTPLMFAAEIGSSKVKRYFKLREIVLHKSEKKSFPKWFQDDVLYYSSLAPDTVQWSWGEHSQNLQISENKLKLTKADQSSDFVAAVGSQALNEGIHTWQLMIERGEMIWVGVARGAEKNLDKAPAKESCESILVFSSEGSILVDGHKGTDKTTVVDRLSSSTFRPGQLIEFVLNTHDHTLTMKIDGRVVSFAHNVDHRDVRPYVCSEYSADITLISNSARVPSTGSFRFPNASTDAAFANELWCEELDNELELLFGSGILCPDKFRD